MSLIKSKKEIDKITQAGYIVKLVHNELKKNIKEGVELLYLDNIAEKIIKENNAIALFKNYEGYPFSICTSINETLVHGIPTSYKLKSGDLISIDVGVKKNGYCADAAFTMGVGKLSIENKKLLETSKKCLDLVISKIKPGIKLYEIGNIIEIFCKENGFNVPRNYFGHGIGKKLHEEPLIPNFYDVSYDLVLKENMTICVEPMLINGEDDLFTDPLDEWSVKTKHGGYTAHDEHTLWITKGGCKILT